MLAEDITRHCGMEVLEDHQLEDEQWIIDSISNMSNVIPRSRPTHRIHRVPVTTRETMTDEYEKYFVPKVVSIGPYHYGNPKLELVEKVKPIFAMKLLEGNKETLRSLVMKLSDPEVVQELRGYYEDEYSTIQYSNKEFVKMMMLDGCFILYFIMYIFEGRAEDCGGLRNIEISFVYQDLFLFENQIPFKVLNKVMMLMNTDCLKKIKLFIEGTIFAPRRPKRRWFWLNSISCIPDDHLNMEFNNTEPDHLLHLIHRAITKKVRAPTKKLVSPQNKLRCNFRNVSELKDVGIHFKPSDIMSLAHIEFSKGWWGFSANVELPPLIVDESTMPKLLNLIVYETYLPNNYDAWVTWYVCLLDSLIDKAEDVKLLRKAWVLEASLGGDIEVVRLFKDLAPRLVPNNLAYLETKDKIQKHYESWRNTLFSQLKNEYVKSPWAFIALLGALIALLFTAVQTYYTVWGPKSTCDDLCMFLKKNHHL